jgi:serine-type D-Ala-D-Ala carboxypeptidase
VIAKVAAVVALSLTAHATTPTALGDGLPKVRPEAVEMSAMRLETVSRIIRRGISEGGYPGAAAVIGRRGAAVYSEGFGKLSWSAEARSVSPDQTIYDLASLTKVIGTTTAIMLLYDEGKLRLEDQVRSFFPEFSGGEKDFVTVRDLLTHRSGLPAGRDLWRLAWSPSDARRMVLETPLEYAPGTHYTYSDLGADILGFIAEKVSGKRLDTFLDERVFTPLGMTETRYRVPADARSRTAPTATISVRGYSLQGDVHDENAAALGGIAGHAGLFSTAGDLSVFASMMLSKGVYKGTRIVSDSAVELFTRRAAGSRALGWDTCAGHNGGGCGRYLSASAFGHTGFTGTSIWIDPARDMFVVLLTNRVFDSRARRPERVIADVRADVADASAWAVTEPGKTIELDGDPEFRADVATGWNPVPEVRYRRASACGSSRSRALARRTAAKRGKAVRRASCSGTSGSSVSKKKGGKVRTVAVARRGKAGAARSSRAVSRRSGVSAKKSTASARSAASRSRPAARKKRR